MRLCVLIALAIISCYTLAAPVTLPHDEYMPADVYSLRQDKPEQILFQVEQYRVLFATEQRPGVVSSTPEASSLLFLQGRSLLPGAAITRAQVSFVPPGVTLRPAQLDGRSQTLMLMYPESMLPLLLQQLESPGAEYVQARFYGNGLIWGDIHSAAQVARP
ncbi:hypothetical protein ACS8E9_08105 [Pseudomonas neustonica]|uniref:Uncharacterized protein n=1 Tax=Pseudomonas neustonica TaxID=2487346 RepID=A0ABX9XKU6_9PSED|nr:MULTISPECIES: hypothetical protein [Pseudomonas]MBA6420508.1 hypothetical protein [Pseudomonas sp. 5Ae-yellow]ROZ83504.1 hypothetical protein EF099_09105 [Pseudomonas sp. SSM44]ROZ85362.1 hypothetical protein EF096_07965 [Pseudomonas neustonica]|tara:strand:- start:2610 stop:3092 length:483 start_codon:yes stop_codon:yes gene_type:complete